MTEPIDYAWPTIEQYEQDVGFKVNEAFRVGWNMARTLNSMFSQPSSVAECNKDPTSD